MTITAEPAPPCFFYGSLMNEKVLNAVTRPGPDSNTLFAIKATVQGYTRFTYHNQPYPGMVLSKDPTETVEGLLVFGHTAQELYRLDQFEGPEYPRSTLPVRLSASVPSSYTLNGRVKGYGEGETVNAYVYLFTGPMEHLDQNRPWDYEKFKKEHVDDWMSIDATFQYMVERAEREP
ncbi:hypothetical protein BGZ96_011277 [Linnemannia gamsii]|uniref:Putative gamma-glutamylcyclotransferase n=1 Tax=Linnemannia gamsii TaxID=64522 RepID=A0ABQ7JSX1_9FUNG|nr:hypothetical protein BGZ96_011277 [Linnemannia gamsii]